MKCVLDDLCRKYPLSLPDLFKPPKTPKKLRKTKMLETKNVRKIKNDSFLLRVFFDQIFGQVFDYAFGQVFDQV